jgi:hypothetical protein
MSTLGQPTEFANCVAEIEEGNPWTPLRVDLGHPKDSNLVTVVTAESYQAVVGLGLTSEQFLSLLADRLIGLHSARMGVLLLILNYDTVDILNDGWRRTAQSTSPSMPDAAAEFKEFNRPAAASGRLPRFRGNRLVERDNRAAIDQLLAWLQAVLREKEHDRPVGGSKAVSREVKLPANWKKVLASAGK